MNETHRFPCALQTRYQVGPESIPVSNIEKLKNNFLKGGGRMSKRLRCLEISSGTEVIISLGFENLVTVGGSLTHSS